MPKPPDTIKLDIPVRKFPADTGHKGAVRIPDSHLKGVTSRPRLACIGGLGIEGASRDTVEAAHTGKASGVDFRFPPVSRLDCGVIPNKIMGR